VAGGGEGFGLAGAKPTKAPSPEASQLATRLATIVKAWSGQARPTSPKWAATIQQLLTQGVPHADVASALEWYAKHIGKPYTPQIFSATALVRKWPNLKAMAGGTGPTLQEDPELDQVIATLRAGLALPTEVDGLVNEVMVGYRVWWLRLPPTTQNAYPTPALYAEDWMRSKVWMLNRGAGLRGLRWSVQTEEFKAWALALAQPHGIPIHELHLG
jgi:hypothetical protein